MAATSGSYLLKQHQASSRGPTPHPSPREAGCRITAPPFPSPSNTRHTVRKEQGKKGMGLRRPDEELA